MEQRLSNLLTGDIQPDKKGKKRTGNKEPMILLKKGKSRLRL